MPTCNLHALLAIIALKMKNIPAHKVTTVQQDQETLKNALLAITLTPKELKTKVNVCLFLLVITPT